MGTIREIFIDCSMDRKADGPIFCERMYVPVGNYEVRFTFTLSVDGRKSVVKECYSRFRDWDMDDEKKLAEVIIRNFSSARVTDIYDVSNPPEQVGDELLIRFSPLCKEVFEFLGKYKQKLLEAFL